MEHFEGEPRIGSRITGRGSAIAVQTDGQMDIEDVIDGVTEEVERIVVLASEDVRRFIAEHGGELYLWVSHHGRGRCRVSLLESSLDRPGDDEDAWRRVPAQFFDLQLEAERRFWPRTLVLEFDPRGRGVCAYWNGQAWVD